MTVLILENKDTWLTFRKLMQSTGKNCIEGVRVELLIYGEGNKITKKGALEEYAAGMLRIREGQIRLFFRTREANAALTIQPFVPLYLLMLKLAQGREMPLSMDKRAMPVDVEGFAALLGGDQTIIINGLLTNGRYITQEIVNYQVLAGILS